MYHHVNIFVPLVCKTKEEKEEKEKESMKKSDI